MTVKRRLLAVVARGEPVPLGCPAPTHTVSLSLSGVIVLLKTRPRTAAFNTGLCPEITEYQNISVLFCLSSLFLGLLGCVCGPLYHIDAYCMRMQYCLF